MTTAPQRQRRRFGPDFVADHVRRFGRRPPQDRQLTYDIAVNDEYEPWRTWLNRQLGHLPEADANAFAQKLWRDQPSGRTWSSSRPGTRCAGPARRSSTNARGEV